MKKLVFLLSLILTILSGFAARAEGEIFSFSFSSEKEALSWSGGYFDESNPFGEGQSIFLNNPFGEVKNDKATHVLDYSSKIQLEEGNVYTLSGYVLNPLSIHSPSVRTQASLEAGANTVIVNINGSGDEWAHFSTTFYAGETGTYNLSLHFADGASDFGFFVDELTLAKTSCILSSLKILGQNEILIPATESVKTYFRPVLITSDGLTVYPLIDKSIYASASAHDGVIFNPSDFSLAVNSTAVSGTQITISCTLRNFQNLAPATHIVKLTDNMLDGNDFVGGDILWETSAKLETISQDGNSYLSLPTNDYGDFGYFSTLTYETPQLLLEGVLYVLHARVKSDSDTPLPAIYAKNTAKLIDNTVFFNIKDISGKEWRDVFTAFVPEVSGVYNIAVNLCSTYDTTVFIDDIRLCSEIIAPQYITLHAPGNIAIPDTATSYNVSAFVRDQLGNILDGKSVSVFLENATESVYFNSETNLLTVLPDAAAGKYTLLALCTDTPSISARLDISISFDYVGDGGFENTVPNEWWMVSSPYEDDLYMRFDGYSRRALINCYGSYFMLLNNSYVHLMENSAYVFNSNFSSSEDCTVTAFIETLDGEMLPLVQFHIPQGHMLDEKLAPELFLAEKECVGRLFLYIEADNAQRFSVYADNISLKKAAVMAGNPHITGSPYVNGSAQAQFSFLNTVAQNSDTSACVVMWYVSDNAQGPYTPVENSGTNIYFDTSFFNKYVYFEVIPVCPITGFSGEGVRCAPFLITYDYLENPYSPSQGSIITLPKFESPEASSYFEDTQNHWGRDYINILAHNDIINGKAQNHFAPDEGVTRAEFAKMLSCTFNIRPYTDFKMFNDVAKKDWFYEYVTALSLAGITGGTSSDMFSPHSYVTREQASAMLVRICEKAGKKVLPLTHVFTDKESISSWAEDFVLKAAALGIIKGDQNGAFRGQDITTRAEAAALIVRLLEVM